MRRREREIIHRDEIDSIIRDCRVCRLAFAVRNEPYIVPLTFGYDGERLYFHTAAKGRKIEFIRKNQRVCFEMERGVQVHGDEDDACRWTCSYESVIGYGDMEELTARNEKIDALNQIMLHYSRREWAFSETSMEKTRVWALRVATVSGKKSVR